MNANPSIPADHPAHALDAYRIVPRGEFAVAEALARPNCPMCNGSGHARTEIEGVITMGRCRCQMLADRVHLFNQAGIPARYVGATFLSFAQTPDGQFKEGYFENNVYKYPLNKGPPIGGITQMRSTVTKASSGF